ncbi:Monothiol glutaredoxin-related protein [Ophiocordyceps sinensis CO18]|uniref:Monothiol glutaredoxin-related protein n=1 Tax=Ophiocordyceps sinensis (strain Co18 / CGMCC 3.14243) TaxID=911162 RepID=T5A2C2_OPHSC|nr:Monothiol glutaredoxin-related protein [Ophiocordyceps sinensis CO18]
MSIISVITSNSEWEQLLASAPASALIVVSFHAPWAAPCAQMATVLETLASEYPGADPPSTLWASINAEDLSDISETYDVTAVPFLVLLRNGQVVETVSGSNAVKVRAAIEMHARGESGAASRTGVTNGIQKITAQPQQDQSKVDTEKQKEDLQKRLGDLVVAILRENSVKYGFFNILADDEVRQGLKEFADWPTYPQLWMDGELVGGLDIVKDELANDPDFFKAYSLGGPTGSAAA